MITRRWLSAMSLALLAGCSTSSNAPVEASPDASAAAALDASASPDASAVPDADAAAPNTSGGGGLGAPDCFGPCCSTPQAGAPCGDAGADASCPTSVRCDGGLGLPFSLVCDGQQWVAHGGYCGDAGIADNGCPTSQPQSGAVCSLPDGTSCQYSLVCSSTCDAATTTPGDASGSVLTTGDASAGSGSSAAGTGCASLAGKIGPAICRTGLWQTQALGTCP
jgi:hypothetical protein